MYVLKLWNQAWGLAAKFVAYDPATKKYTEYSPRRTKDVVWTSTDLTQSEQYREWEDCNNEEIQELEDAII